MYDAGEFSPASKVIKHLTGTEKKVDNVNTLKLKESIWTEDQYIDFTCGSAQRSLRLLMVAEKIRNHK